MGFDYDYEDDAEMLRAEELVEEGRELAQGGDILGGLHTIRRAIEIFNYAGKYFKVAELFNLLVAYTKTETQMLPVIDELQNTIATIEYLDLPEEEAELKLALANFMYRSKDYSSAGNLFIEVTKKYEELEINDICHRCGMFLMRAGECFEKIGRPERAERLIINAIQKFQMSTFDYKAEWQQLKLDITKKKYQDAIETVSNIIEYFEGLETELNDSEQ